jgi:hypothetical protein
MYDYRPVWIRAGIARLIEYHEKRLTAKAKQLISSLEDALHDPADEQQYFVAGEGGGRMRAPYLERLKVLLEDLHSELGGVVTAKRPDTGKHVGDRRDR